MKLTFPPRRILAPVDLSAPSLSALSAAKELAERFRARLEALYVEDLEPLATFAEGVPPGSLAAAERARADFRREWNEKLLGALDGLLPAPKLTLTRGQPSAEIARRAALRTADLVVMGTHGRAGGERFFMGSVAEAVVHRARVPVLALRAGARLSSGPVLIPCRLTRYADEALFYALELAQALGAKPVVLYVPLREEWELDSQLKVRAHLDGVFGAEAARGVEVVVRPGEDARTEILREAQSGRYAMLALSAHLRSRLSDLALGSTAERLLRRCVVPLLAVPAGSGAGEPARRRAAGRRARRPQRV